MAHHHSSVNYVEPNITSAGFYKETSADNAMPWKVKDDYDRAPRLEDYSIYFNLEVEICSRENLPIKQLRQMCLFCRIIQNQVKVLLQLISWVALRLNAVMPIIVQCNISQQTMQICMLVI